MLRKAVLLILLAIAGGLACRFTPLGDWLAPAGQVSEWLRRAGVVGALGFVVATGVLILGGVPRLLFCVVGGALYGFWWGLTLTLVATTASYYATYQFLRGQNRRGARPPQPTGSLAWLARDPGMGGVIVARLLPLHGMVINVMLALSQVSRSDFLVGTVIGLLPEAVPLVLIGAGLVHHDSSRILQWLIVGVAMVVATLAVIYRVLKRRRPESAPNA